ncbi:MAG: hypothetical protein JWM00_327 [Candidatus Saccharibacteria bacterium]|nr:hypothetical protein [Candidatus Saccharibacteria bacterium]
MEPTLFSPDDYPQLKTYKLLREAILDKSGKQYEFTRGNFMYIIHRENEMMLELHTQYEVDSSSFGIGPWGYVMVMHNGTGSLDQTILRAYYIIPPGDTLEKPTPILIGKDFSILDEAMDTLEESLMDAGEDNDNEDTYVGDIHEFGVSHAGPIE